LDEDVIEELLKYGESLVDDIELNNLKNMIIHLPDLDANIIKPFLTLSICYITLYYPDVLKDKDWKTMDRFIQAFYHSLGEDTYVNLSRYIDFDDDNIQFGLYAKRSFKKGEKVSYFYGSMKEGKKEPNKEKYITDYNIQLSKDKYFYVLRKALIEANAHYSNCNLKKKEANSKISNKTSKDKKTINLIAIKNIKEDSEILCDYGDDYRESIKCELRRHSL
jgi:hypothetical protein